RDERQGHGVPGQGQRAEDVREHFSIPFLGPGLWSLPSRTGGALGHVSPDRPTPRTDAGYGTARPGRGRAVHVAGRGRGTSGTRKPWTRTARAKASIRGSPSGRRS